MMSIYRFFHAENHLTAVMHMMVSSFCSVVSKAWYIRQWTKPFGNTGLEDLSQQQQNGEMFARDACLALIDGLQTFNSGGLRHNDIKEDIIMLHRVDNNFQPILIDCGACRSLTHGYSVKVFESEPGQNTEALFPHTAPELFHHRCCSLR